MLAVAPFVGGSVKSPNAHAILAFCGPSIGSEPGMANELARRCNHPNRLCRRCRAFQMVDWQVAVGEVI
jgi:hypothetical protein